MTLSPDRSWAPPPGPPACATCTIGVGCEALLRRAASGGDDAAPALAALVEAWWPAVYAMARRQGFRAADAEDVTQAYFARFLEKGDVHEAAQWGGCFRPFLYTTARHFFSNQRDRERALKRGGGQRHQSLGGATDSDERPAPEPRDPSTPETLLNADRSHSVAAAAFRALALEMRSSGRGSRFDRVARYLVGDVPRGAYRALAEEWGISESAVRIFVFRLRRRLRTRLSSL